MVKKICAAALAVLLCVALTACAEKPQIRSAGGVYEVTGVRTDGEYEGTAAPDGRSYLLVQVKGENADMDDMQATFFGVEKERVTVSDGSAALPCALITYEPSDGEDAPDVTATLVFSVPEGFPKAFTLAGEAFASVTLETKNSFLDPLLNLFR